VERSFSAIQRADVVVLVMDAGAGITEQDFRLAEHASQQVGFQ
jgi:predicted GTPase